MVFIEEGKAFIKILYLTIGYELGRLPWQTMNKVWIGQTYHEAT